jgi:hypothetical protein
MTKRKSKHQAKDGNYYLVNPAGAVHSCTRDHARMRLATVGWRLATDEEIERYLDQHEQRHDRPIAERWSPEPDVEPEVPEAEDAAK